MKSKANLEVKFIISLIFAVVVAIFAIQNAGSIEVKFFFANFRISQAVVILGSAIIGAIISLLLGLIKQLKHNRAVKQLSQEIEALKLENNDLKVKLHGLSTSKTEENIGEELGQVVGETVVESNSLDEEAQN